MGCEYAEKERECLRLSECGLREMIYELRLRGMNHSLHTWAVLVEISCWAWP